MKNITLNKFFIKLIIISLAISPAFALDPTNNKNLLLICIMCIAPILILFFGKLKSFNILLILFLLTIISIPYFHQPQSLRWSTIFFSILFSLNFFSYRGLLYQNYFTATNYLLVLKYLILAYFIMLVIQQLCLLLGLPILNLSNYNPLEPWKLNSLSAEPSHSARIVALLMYSFITIKELLYHGKYNFRVEIKKDKWVWIAFLWTMLTMISGTAFLFLFIFTLKFLKRKNLILLLILLGAFLLVINNFEFIEFERAQKTFMATITFQEDKIVEADHSASVRILPMIILAKMVGFSTLNDWFGYGIDYVSTFMSDLIPGVPEGISGGGLLQLWMEYGFISFFLFFLFSLKNSYAKGEYLSVLFWFMLVFLYGVNSQIVWLCITLLITNKYFIKKYKKYKKLNYANT